MTPLQASRVIRTCIAKDPDFTEFQARTVWEGLVGMPLPRYKPKVLQGYDGWRVFYVVRTKDLAGYTLTFRVFPSWTRAVRWARTAPN